MFKKNISVLRMLVTQVGLRRALQLTTAKACRRLFAPNSNFYYSQTGEDLILSFLISRHLKKQVVTYVEVGCHDARKISNTYLHYLRGSCGLTIDLGEHYAVGFHRERPNDVFVCAAVSEKSGVADVYEFSASEVNTIDAAQAKVWKDTWRLEGKRQIQTVRLQDLVAEYLPGKKIDILLLDVEGHEYAVLQGADLTLMQPKIIVCEIHELDLADASANPVAALLIRNGFRLVAYATMNAYFAHESV